MDLRESWNKALRLTSPTLAALEETLGHRERLPLFPWPSERVFLGGGFVAVLRIGDEPMDDSPVISLQFVFDAGYYTGALASRFARAPELTMLGIPLPTSAQHFLESVKRKLRRSDRGRVSIQLETTPDEWVVRVGQALSFYFLPTSDTPASNPAASRLHVVEFCYQLDYEGDTVPTMV